MTGNYRHPQILVTVIIHDERDIEWAPQALSLFCQEQGGFGCLESRRPCRFRKSLATGCSATSLTESEVELTAHVLYRVSRI